MLVHSERKKWFVDKVLLPAIVVPTAFLLLALAGILGNVLMALTVYAFEMAPIPALFLLVCWIAHSNKK